MVYAVHEESSHVVSESAPIFFDLLSCTGDAQGGLACCDTLGHKESDTTE